MTPQPLLSVLIPAYNQPAGVDRILAGLAGLGAPGDIEIRVADDSTHDAAAAHIAASVQAAGGHCHYQRNRPPLGAVRNWNSLLAQARGRYVWLLHHDEEPDGPAELAPLLAALRQGSADIWILRCRVQHRPGARPRLHFPPRWAAAVLRRWPGYLLRRNLIGPPSALVVRDHAVVGFDERLAWLVDVEAYVRLLAGGGRLAAWPQAGVLSRVDAAHSITAALQPGLAATKRREMAQLAGSADTRLARLARPWAAATLRARVWRAVEAMLWAGLRAGQRLVPRAQGR